MKIIADAMGGDNAPREIVKGAIEAVKEFNIEVILVGRGEEILQIIKDEGLNEIPKGIIIHHASEVINMEDNPSLSVKEKTDSSMVVGLKMLSEGEGVAFVSAGNTGALLSGATLFVKRVRGIRRAALTPFLPTAIGHVLLIDCGANVECTPEYLLQFACMGSFFAAAQLKIDKPRVGLLNIGTEETKGTELQKGAYKLLEKAHAEGIINFVGNVEGRDIPIGGCDVCVTDGYSGNILLKTMEGTGLLFAGFIKTMFTKNIFTKIAALLVNDGIKGIKKTMDYTETGGSPLLGLQKPVIKAHGSSNAKAFKNALRQAKMFAESDVIGGIERNIGKMKIPENE